MEKTIEIDGKKVKLKSTAGTPKRYKAQFRHDYFSELLKLSKLMAGTDGKTFNLAEIDYSELEYLDFEVFYNFIWVLAKTANKDTRTITFRLFKSNFSTRNTIFLSPFCTISIT